MIALIVDDSEANRYLLESLLKAEGWRTISVSNGQEAIQQLARSRFDLIISDILMPVMDGFQLCRKVKTDESLSGIPFIIYTATYTGSQDEAFALKIGADRFLVKPCEPHEFMRAVGEVMKESESANPIHPIPADEGEVFRLYSERLVRKLEQKMLEVEKELKARQEAETALRKSRERLLEAQRMAGMGTFTWNPATGDVYWSEAMYDLLGYTSDEMINMSMVNSSIHHPDDLQRVVNWLDGCISSGVVKHGPEEYRILHHNGSVMHVQTRLSIGYSQGRAVEVLGTVQDITRRKKAEEEQEKLRQQLAQSQRLESVGRLANSVAHDFNNLLSVILGYGESILNQIQSGDPIKEEMEEIVQAGRRSAAITGQLLAFSSKQNLQPEVMSINVVLKNLQKMLKRLIGDNIELVISLDSHAGMVLADPVQIEQVIMNLAVNARDAMPEGGALRMETGRALLDEAFAHSHPEVHPGDYVSFSVSDNGSGIEKDVLPHIFDPFFTTKEKGKGTGLGLSTVYGIVKQFGGTICVDSEPRQGTTFRIYLPLTESDLPGESPPDEDEAQASGQAQVLLVEDEDSVRKLVESILRKMGCTVVSAADAYEAVQRVEKGLVPDLLITDVNLPGLNGIQLSEMLGKSCPGIKALLMSGSSGNSFLENQFDDPEINFIQKPFHTRDFTRAVMSALGGTAGDC